MFDATMAERGGFEPPEEQALQQISSLPHSTTLPPLHTETINENI